MHKQLIAMVVMLGTVVALAQERPADPWALVTQDQVDDAYQAFQVATAGQTLRLDPTLTTKTGALTLQIDQQIKAPATLSQSEWATYLLSQWPSAMEKIAARLKACGCTLLGLRGGAPATSVGAVYANDLSGGLRIRFTRSSTTLTAHIDILAGK